MKEKLSVLMMPSLIPNSSAIKIKNIIDPIPDFELKTISTDTRETILELHVPSGNMTPYYYVNSGCRIAFIRVGDESVVATSNQLSSLVLKGRNV